MKVLFLTESLTIPGGWARYSRDLISALAEKGVEPVVLASRPEPLGGFAFNPQPVELAWAEWGPRMFLATPLNLWRLRPFLAGAALIHALVEPLGPLAWAAARLSGRPYLISAHGTYSAEPFVLGKGARLGRLAFRGAGAIACVSGYTSQRLARLCPGAKGVAVPNGSSPPRIDSLPACPVKRPYFLSVGALKSRKGQHLVLEAFQGLAGRYPDIDWVLAGFSYRQQFPGSFAARVEEMGLQDRVHLLGEVDEATLQRLYDDCLFNVLTPLNDEYAFEGFGLTYLEAGWHAKPSVGSLDCGAEESIADGVEGFLVPQGDAGRLAEALERLIRDEGLRLRMGQAARQRAEAMTWPVTAGRMLDLYEEVSRSHGRRT